MHLVNWRSRAAALSVAFAAAVVVPLGGSAVCAEEAGPRAALVVSTGSGTTTYCVSLGSSSVTGIDLIRKAGSQHGLQYRLGFGGQAVCQLAGVGPSSGDCFAQHPDFWGFWVGTGGGWRWSSTGAGSVSVSDGGVHGWAWGRGDTAGQHPQPPVTAFSDVCQGGPSSSPPSSGGGGGGGGGSGAGGSGGPGGGAGLPTVSASPDEASDDSSPGSSKEGRSSDEDGDEKAPGKQEDGSRQDQEPAEPDATRAAEDQTTAPLSSPVDAGPPVGALIALAGMAALGVAGWVALRRRRSELG